MFLGMLLSLLFLSACGKGGKTATSQTTGGDLLAEVKKRGKLVISTDDSYKPSSFKNPDGSFDGHDVKVGEEVARRLGVQAEFLHFDFTMITAGGWNGRFDMNAGGLTPTPARRKSLFFSSPYIYTGNVFVVHKNSRVTSVDALRGKKIGVGAATVSHAYLENRLTLDSGQHIKPAPAEIEVKAMSDPDALTDLALGDGTRLHAVLAPLPYVENAINGGLPLKILGDSFLHAEGTLAFDRTSPLDSQSLVDAVNGAIADMHKDGTLSRLSKKYFGSDFSKK